MTPTYPKLSEVSLEGKRVLLRAGFDLPIQDGVVQDTTRVEAIVPTMKHILESGASLIIIAHQGRPKGQVVTEMSQEPIVPILQDLLNADVAFAPLRGAETKAAAENLQPGQVLLLENLRFDPAEKSKEKDERDVLGKELADLADLYVNDAFTNCHRNHASMTSVPKFIPAYMGLQLEKEVEHLSTALHGDAENITLIISGAKMETKIPVIENFLGRGTDILLGGCIANTFIAAEGFDIAESKYEEDYVEQAQNILLESEKDGTATVHVPTDAIVASSPDAAEECVDLPLEDIEGDMKIFDIGTQTTNAYCDILKQSDLVIWNGPLGMYEQQPFSRCSASVAQTLHELAKQGKTVIIGGGDTIDFHERYNAPIDSYTFMSTGGGAMLEFIGGKNLPALAALRNQ